MGISSHVNEGEEAGFPRGCSVNTQEGFEGIYFNPHPSGSSEEDSRQVCKDEVLGMLSKYVAIL